MHFNFGYKIFSNIYKLSNLKEYKDTRITYGYSLSNETYIKGKNYVSFKFT